MTGLKWCRRTTCNLAEELTSSGIFVSPNTVCRLLHQMGYSLRVNHKQIATSKSPDRNRQFEYLTGLRAQFQRRHLPVISVDTKKRELVGNFKNPGQRWDREPRRVYDHDFRTDAEGIAIPYGIYDVQLNRGTFVIGVSHDTPAFAAHSIALWWEREGTHNYRRASEILILADSGGSNSSRTRAWKTELQSQLADAHRLKVTVAHYPTGASKWNPIEHRLFCWLSKNWAGEPLESYQKILNFARTTTTRTGLSVTAYLDRHHYQTGIKPSSEEYAAIKIRQHDILPRWNYTLSPRM